MTPEDFLKNIENAIEQTVEDLKPTMEEAALTAKALLARRIQNSGLNKKYSQNKLPIFFFRGRGLQKADTERFLDKKQKEGVGVSYSEWRKANLLPVGNIRLTFTGNMFSGWKRPGTSRTGLKVSGTVGGVDQETIQKLKWNKSRFPQFDKTNEEERKILIESLIKPRVTAALQKNLFKS